MVGAFKNNRIKFIYFVYMPSIVVTFPSLLQTLQTLVLPYTNISANMQARLKQQDKRINLDYA